MADIITINAVRGQSELFASGTVAYTYHVDSSKIDNLVPLYQTQLTQMDDSRRNSTRNHALTAASIVFIALCNLSLLATALIAFVGTAIVLGTSNDSLKERAKVEQMFQAFVQSLKNHVDFKRPITFDNENHRLNLLMADYTLKK